MYTKRCKICDREFQTTSKLAKYCQGPHIAKCPICGKEEIVYKGNSKFLKLDATCSYECRVKKTQQTSLERYGCLAPGNNPEARKKAKATMVEKYGAETTLQSEELKTKVQSTVKSKYGVENVQQNAEIKAKSVATQREKFNGKLAFNQPSSYQHRHETIVKKYGSETSFGQYVRTKISDSLEDQYGVREPMLVPEIAAKRKSTMLEIYGVEEPFHSEEIKEKYRKTMLERYGVENPSHSKELVEKADATMRKRYGKPARISKVNQLFGELLTSNNILFEPEFFLEGKWFDFILPSKQILIEIDPIYTHNYYDNKWGNPYPKDYQLRKTQLAQKHGYACIHVFDWDSKDKIMDLFKPSIKIFARSCEITQIDDKTAKEFEILYHLQNACRGQILCYGLYYQNELVEVMTFGKPRYNRNYDWELLRLCTKSNLTVIGGASKLFKHAVLENNLDNIISYCDRSKFGGSVYTQIGMTFKEFTEPNTIWSDGKKHITQNLLNSRGYDQLFGTHYGKGTSNEQLMLDHHWLPMGDCGQAVYEYRSK